jgi:hypothetical protein
MVVADPEHWMTLTDSNRISMEAGSFAPVVALQAEAGPRSGRGGKEKRRVKKPNPGSCSSMR